MHLADTEITTLASVISSQRTDVFPICLMAFINAIVPVDITLVVGFSAQAEPIELFRDFDAHSEQQYLRLYASGAYLLDPFYKISVDGTPSGLYPLRDVAPDRFFKSEYYFSYYRKLPLMDEICLTHRVSPNWCLTYSMGRTPDSGLFSAREKRRLRDMEPVLRALMLSQWEETLLATERKGRLRDLNEMTARIFNYSKSLTPKGISPREAEIAALILQGHSSPSIAANLRIAIGTVKVLRKRLYSKLNISSQNELYQVFFPSVMGLPDA
ncbi:transcriptional regulator, LuxR family [Roseovarius azorensis]|uniref:Transcriptional regulator, LuxR family n=1 Tax=Roseovarius azorensis TaxID=1287727 RepID=A0A1H7XFV5_9RHOB|nr:helix-turn-helix transcriptional regulator [Roseovarius azorensis]SEM32611.1 transcriptional regulator, LuxR family [Roseovarius azorensis]